MRDSRYDILFEPIKIGPVTAPNRFVSVPHALGHSPLMPHGSMGIRTVRAEGGWGIIGMQLAEIDPTSDISDLPVERFWDSTDVKSQRLLTDRLRELGSLSSIELAHTGLRSRGIGTGYPPMGPSSLPILKPTSTVHSKSINKSEIKELRQSFRSAVRRAIEAGYDIAYVYAAHDASILWHFLSPSYNFRKDEYGGSFENRLRLMREVLEEAKEEAKDDIAIAIRFAVHELNGPKSILYEGEGRAVVETLAELPDLWDVNVSGWSRDSGTSRFDGEGFQEEFVNFVKQVTTKPVLGVGRFTSPTTMVSMIKRGVLDLVGAARPSIADPFLPNKIKSGNIDDIRECIGCNICVSADAMGVELRCTQNPTISEEWRRNWHPEHVPAASSPENSLIVGSGPAGLEAAWVLARAGHEVTVAEARSEFGGRSTRESALFGLAAWSRVKDYRLYQLRQMANVNLYGESELDAESVVEFASDNVLLATGANWRSDGFGRSHFKSIPGFTGNALTPDDVMDGCEINGTVVIYDDEHYYMGNVLAAELAKRGHEVHLVCPLPVIASYMNYTIEQPRVVAQLHALGVKMYPNTVANCWANRSLSVARADIRQELPAIQAGTLIFVGARQPRDTLSSELSALGINYRNLGDCEAPGIIQAAVYSGHRHAREILGHEPEDRIYKRELPHLPQLDKSEWLFKGPAF